MNPSSADNVAVLIDLFGVIDIDRPSVHSIDEITSTTQSLQSNITIPYGSIPVNDYNNPIFWIGFYP